MKMMNYESQLLQCTQLKEKLDGLRPFAPDALKQLKAYYRVNLTYTSNAIEGSTLTEIETKVVLEDGITIGGKPMKDHLAAVGHAKAYDHLYTLLEQPTVTEADILALHQLVALDDTDALPGQYRSKGVIITGSEFTPPPASDVPALMTTFINQKLQNWQKQKHPVESAALAHLELAHIHPFQDGNGRTARLLMNLLLMKSGYAITIIPPVVRQDYIATLDKAHLSGDSEAFINFMSNMAAEGLKNQLRLINALNAD